MIARMDRIEIVCLREILPDMVVFLQNEGVLHIEEVPLAVENHPGFLHRVHLRDDQKVAVESLEDLERMLAEIEPLLSVRPTPDAIATAAQALEKTGQDTWRRTVRGWSRELRSAARRKSNISDNIEILRNHYEMLKSIEPALGGDVILGKDARAFVVRGQAGDLIPRLRKRLVEHIGPEVRLVHRDAAQNATVCAVTYPPSKDDAVGRLLHDQGITPVELPDRALQGIPLAEVLEQTNGRIAEQQERLAEITTELAELSQNIGADLAALKAMVADKLSQLRVVTRFAQSEMIAVVHGWMPRDKTKPFNEALHKRFPGQVQFERLPSAHVERKRIPILLRNPRLLEPFEVLLSLFNPPRYGTMDASILVGVFFVFFYGFILGDAIYGLAVIGFAAFLRYKWGHIKAVRAASTVGFYAGISATVFGVLYGEYCGDLGTRLFGLQPIWFHRGHDTLKLLRLAIYIGAAHIVLSLLLGIWANYRLGEVKHAMERLAMLMGLTAVGLFVASIMNMLPGPPAAHFLIAIGLIIGAAVILFIYTGWFAAVHLLEIISLTGNVISYSRLMALGIASVALADVANNLGEMADNPLYGIPIALTIHLVNVTLGMFSPTLHSLRLNYVEFLPKFYLPEGRHYQPFKKEASW